MRRLLAPAFLTTVSLASGCTKKPVDDGNTHNPPAQFDHPDADDTRLRTQNPPPVDSKTTKKRKRTAAADYSATGSGNGSTTSFKMLNPSDAKGRMIQAMSDDRCAVSVPFTGPMPTNRPTGWTPRQYEYVDCPTEMDDPAWDDCTYHLAFDTSSQSCFCLPDGGNPPPPPRKQKCTANAKEVAQKK